MPSEASAGPKGAPSRAGHGVEDHAARQAQPYKWHVTYQELRRSFTEFPAAAAGSNGSTRGGPSTATEPAAWAVGRGWTRSMHELESVNGRKASRGFGSRGDLAVLVRSLSCVRNWQERWERELLCRRADHSADGIMAPNGAVSLRAAHRVRHGASDLSRHSFASGRGTSALRVNAHTRRGVSC